MSINTTRVNWASLVNIELILLVAFAAAISAIKTNITFKAFLTIPATIIIIATGVFMIFWVEKRMESFLKFLLSKNVMNKPGYPLGHLLIHGGSIIILTGLLGTFFRTDGVTLIISAMSIEFALLMMYYIKPRVASVMLGIIIGEVALAFLEFGKVQTPISTILTKGMILTFTLVTSVTTILWILVAKSRASRILRRTYENATIRK